MSVKGSKSTAVKVVKKIKKDLAAMKKPISKAAKRIVKDISSVKKPISKAAKKLARDVSGMKKPAKSAASKAKKAVKKKVAAVKRPKVAKKVAKRKVAKKSAKKSVRSSAKKRPAAKSARRATKKAPARKTGSKVKKKVKKSGKAKAGKKVGRSKTARAAKSKKSAKKAKAVKKGKSSKEEKKKAAKPLKKKLVKAISKAKPKKIAVKVSQKVGPVSKGSKIPAVKKSGGRHSAGLIAGSTTPKIFRSPPSMTDIASAPATSLMSGAIPPYKERIGEEYMNEAQQAHFRKLLKAWKDQLVRDMAVTVHHMQDEAANFPDPNDRATQEEEFSLELRTRDRELKLIKKIEEAIHKLDNHEYGYCESCGVKIGIRRLEARPTATLCIDCKTLDEIREKQLAG